MNKGEKTKAELVVDLEKLQAEYNSMRELYEKKISDLTKSEEKITKRHEKFTLAYLTSPDSICITRLSDGIYVFVNESFTKILGYIAKEIVGKTSQDMNIWVNPGDFTRLVKEVTANGKVDNIEVKLRTKEGNILNGLLSASLIDQDSDPFILTVVRDLTIRKKTEEALAKEQFLINALMNNLTDHVYFKDMESKFIRSNRAHALSFGLDDPEKMVGKSDFDFFTEPDARQAFEDEQRIIRTGQPILKEEQFTRKNSSNAWFSVIKMPLLDNAGNIIGTFGISRDITTHMKAEEQLFLLANALKSINECVSITDMNDKVLFLNRAFITTYGFDENDLKEEAIGLIRSPNNKPEIVNSILPATLLGGWNGELLNRKKNGEEFLISLSTAVIKDNQEKPIAMIGVASDITTRKRTELENQINYEITQGITSTSNLDELLKLIHHSLGKVVYAENCFVVLYDQSTGLFNFPYFVDKVDPRPESAPLGKSCSAYVFHNVKPLLLTQQIFNQMAERGEVELVGTNAPSWIGIPLRTPSKVIGVLVLQHYEKENVYSENDVKFLVSIGSQIAMAIERKKSEEEISLKNEQLLAINAEKDKFFSIIAHDLKGPLSAFVDATQILSEEIQSMKIEEIKDITQSMKISASNIYNLLENLLEWSRLKRGVLNFVQEKINLKTNVKECIDILSESAKKKKIEIEISIPEDMEIFADTHMMETVIRNLVSNAIKFTSAGGNIKVIADQYNSNFIEIKVVDSGIGMTPDLISKLFMISEKTNRIGTEGEQSTGLGLLLCKEFIEKNGGRIWVESEVGKGSTFTFIIPECVKKSV